MVGATMLFFLSGNTLKRLRNFGWFSTWIDGIKVMCFGNQTSEL
jgi:hypothetical protein